MSVCWVTWDCFLMKKIDNRENLSLIADEIKEENSSRKYLSKMYGT